VAGLGCNVLLVLHPYWPRPAAAGWEGPHPSWAWATPRWTGRPASPPENGPWRPGGARGPRASPPPKLLLGDIALEALQGGYRALGLGIQGAGGTEYPKGDRLREGKGAHSIRVVQGDHGTKGPGRHIYGTLQPRLIQGLALCLNGAVPQQRLDGIGPLNGQAGCRSARGLDRYAAACAFWWGGVEVARGS